MSEHAQHQEHPSATRTDDRKPFLSLFSIVLGAIIGIGIGLLLHNGSIAIGRLSILTSASRAVPAVVCGVFFASLFGLVAALATVKRTGNEHKHPSDLATILPTTGMVAIVLFMAFTLITIARRAVGSGEPSDQSNRVTWNQKNAIRVGGPTDAETFRRTLEIAFPRPPSVVVRVPNDWRAAVAATPLIARPTAAAVIPEGEAMPFAPTETLTGDAATIAAAVDTRMSARSTAVMIVSGDAPAALSMPAAAYAARTGTPILFVSGNGIPAPTADALQKRNGRAHIYVAGGVSDDVRRQLRKYGRVQRAGEDDAFANAVSFARFRDPVTRFGWGRDGRGASRYVNFSAALVSPQRWQDAIAAAHLARGGKSGPLLFVKQNDIPARVDAYLWQQRPVFKATPAEGPFNSVWIVGSFDRVSYGTQAWADYSQEIEQYMSLGDSGVSGFEALTICWLIISFAVAIFIYIHAMRRVPHIMPMMHMAWTVFALLLGPIALLLYLHSYGDWPTMKHDGMTMWQRSFFGQTVSATVMMFAFDMMLMVLAVFALAYLGFPIIRGTTSWYWAGTAMFLMMVGMYVVALILMMLLFHTPMTMHEKKLPYWRAFAAGFPIMFLTMTVESAGMMPTMWWAQMYFLPAMQMPTDDDLTMWGTLLMAVMAGWLVVLPANAWMVKRGWKMGGM